MIVISWEGAEMKKMAALFGLSLLLSAIQFSVVQAAGLPPGVTVEVIKEYPASLIPGAKSITQKLFILQPGAKLENFTPPGVHICTAIFGEAKVVIGGKTIIRKAGTLWIEEKGVPFTITNEGNVPFVDMFFQVVYEK